MRFMLLLKGDPAAPAPGDGGDSGEQVGAAPSQELIDAMMAFNTEMAKAGVLLAGEGLHPSGFGSRVIYSREKGRRVVDGPFTEAKEIIAGYYLIQVASKEEAIEWASRCPVEYAPIPEGEEAVIEVRQVAEMDDLPTATEEQKAAERALREQVSAHTAR